MKNILPLATSFFLIGSLALTGCTKSKTHRFAKAVPVPVEVPVVAPVKAPAPVVPEITTTKVATSNKSGKPSWEQLQPEMTKEEVARLVGTPNAKSDRKWVYISGAWVMFSAQGLLADYAPPRH